MSWLEEVAGHGGFFGKGRVMSMMTMLLALNVRKFIIHQVGMTMASAVDGFRELT